MDRFSIGLADKLSSGYALQYFSYLCISITFICGYVEENSPLENLEFLEEKRKLFEAPIFKILVRL